MATASLPDWIRPARCGARTLPAGRWFDVVQVPSLASVYVLGRLDTRTGPVVEVQEHGVVCWLVPPRGGCLTDAGALRAALEATLLAPAPELAEPEWFVVMTGREGPVSHSEPVTCGYCNHGIVADDDHAVDCCWRPGKAAAR
ncbi:hypothetical protein [Streptomyces mayteni]